MNCIDLIERQYANTAFVAERNAGPVCLLISMQTSFARLASKDIL